MYCSVDFLPSTWSAMIKKSFSEPIAPPVDGGTLKFLYNNVFGRSLLRVLISRPVSKLAGAYLSSRLSKGLIKKFVANNHIDLNDFYSDNFRCFNDCFCRKIKEGKRPLENGLIAPCDGLLSVYPIENGLVLPIKQSQYSIADLLQDSELAKEFEGGTVLVFRLCVNHYHRYCYFDDGVKGENKFIKGRLHTVRPIALRRYPVFAQNCREMTVMDTKHFGKAIQIEVGAMLVGKIANLHQSGEIKRGDEKGMFLYGGSTIVLLLGKDAATLPQELFDATNNGLETPVCMGEQIGE